MNIYGKSEEIAVRLRFPNIVARYPVSDLYGFDVGNYDGFWSLWRARYRRFDRPSIDRQRNNVSILR
jgi:hypothetical protein